MDVRHVRPDAAIRVVQKVIFDSAEAQLQPAHPAYDTPAPAAGDQALGPLLLPAAGQPLEVTDARIEERPRMLQCKSTRSRPPRDEAYRSREEAQRAMDLAARASSGNIDARGLVDTNGRVPRDRITVISSTNPTMTEKLLDDLASCRYAPARIGGVAVPVVMPMSIRVTVTNRPL